MHAGLALLASLGPLGSGGALRATIGLLGLRASGSALGPIIVLARCGKNRRCSGREEKE
jgi:hypothetical protein